MREPREHTDTAVMCQQGMEASGEKHAGRAHEVASLARYLRSLSMVGMDHPPIRSLNSGPRRSVDGVRLPVRYAKRALERGSNHIVDHRRWCGCCHLACVTFDF